MVLVDVVAQLLDLPGEATIYAAGGHLASLGSTAVVAFEPEDGSVPAEAEAEGLAYVLEVDEAQEVVRVWSAWRDGRIPSIEEATQAILFYAANDAFMPLT